MGSARTGTVEGSVQLTVAARRVAPQYLAGGARQRTVQQVPAVAMITTVPRSSPRGQSSSVRMAQKDTAFTPPILVVDVGTTVEFPNQDPFFHNVFSYSSAKRFDLGRYPRGESRSVRFDEPGMVKVYCEVHDFMRSVVVIAENPYHAVVGEDGGFTIRDVPAGRHTLLIWHPEQGNREVTVEIVAGATTRVDVKLP